MSCRLLHRIDPSRNMARFYRVEMLYDLFGAITVERCWGRLGTHGQVRVASFASDRVATETAAKLVGAKIRRGYVAID
ncbi:MAG: WGR domain-containing protein [Cereibacter sphaeroides]|uniref:WGR domain-containing protein n=1 Tax=Cereibacter sphaeroides TaxID=1063 RepID=A0A2W5S3A2_CERSP|nr:MAG: WGR domain-containing protein [Cereibacter sphaeroides]